MHRGQFQAILGKPLRLQSHNWRASQKTEDIGLKKKLPTMTSDLSEGKGWAVKTSYTILCLIWHSASCCLVKKENLRHFLPSQSSKVSLRQKAGEVD